LKKVCRLAFAQYYARNKGERTPGAMEAVRAYLQDLTREDVCFAFFKDYVGEAPEMEEYEDKAIVEYKTSPGSKVWIHYLVEKGPHTQEKYGQEEMKDMYGGVYAMPFVLFFGEKLQYYISEENEDGEHVTETASVSPANSLPEGAEGRFAHINGIVAAQAVEDYDTADRLLTDYYRKEYVAPKVFRLK